MSLVVRFLLLGLVGSCDVLCNKMLSSSDDLRTILKLTSIVSLPHLIFDLSNYGYGNYYGQYLNYGGQYGQYA